MKMKKLKKDQRGLTLIELVIVIALTGIITAGITMTIFQVFNMNTRTSNRMTAVSQVEHAGKLVSEDILEAQNVTPGANAGFPLTLTWTEVGEAPNTYKVIYKLEDTSGPTILWREYYIGSDPDSLSLNSTTKVAEYIDPDQTSIDPSTPCYFPDCGAFRYTLEVTANVGGQSETREYEVKPRPGS